MLSYYEAGDSLAEGAKRRPKRECPQQTAARGIGADSEPDQALSSRQVSHSERTQTERNGPSPSGLAGGPIAAGDEKIHLMAEGLTLESMAMPQAAPTATERSEVCSRSVASLRLLSVWGLPPGALADVPG